MKRIMFTSAWLFILLAAAYDSYFAWNERADFDSWEMNPLARWLVKNCSINSLLILKAGVMLFAGAVAVFCRRRQNRLAIPMTLVIGCFYVLLSVHYFLGYFTNIDWQLFPGGRQALATIPVNTGRVP